MTVSYTKQINYSKNNRIEFWLNNFDYFDGNELLSKLFIETYNMRIGNKIDGIYYTIISVCSEDTNYELMWHEDVGNIVYSTNQEKVAVDQLEQRLEVIIEKVNELTNKEM